MAVMRHEPWNLISQIQNEMNKLLDNRMSLYTGEDAGNVVTSEWAPAVDIKEERDRFVLYADVPGVDPKDIEITMEDNTLSIRGTRLTVSEQERDLFKRAERAHGSFYRRFALPDTADAERISARGRHGVLEITIPKQEKVQPRKISVEGEH
jgi:HSP20 family protein